jgi:hypothetical protein
MAVGEAALYEQGGGGGGGGDELLAGQRAADEADEVGGQVRDVAEGFVLDLGAGAEGAAEEVGLVELAFVEAPGGGYMDAAMPGAHSHCNGAVTEKQEECGMFSGCLQKIQMNVIDCTD